MECSVTLEVLRVFDRVLLLDVGRAPAVLELLPGLRESQTAASARGRSVEVLVEVVRTDGRPRAAYPSTQGA